MLEPDNKISTNKAMTNSIILPMLTKFRKPNPVISTQYATPINRKGTINENRKIQNVFTIPNNQLFDIRLKCALVDLTGA